MRILHFTISAGLHLVFLLFTDFYSEAQDLQYKLYTYPEFTTANRQVYSIVQDKTGFIYLQTRQHLFRFDGSHPEEAGSKFRLSVVTHLFQTHTGNILLLHDSGIYQTENTGDFQTKKIMDCRNPVNLYEDTKGGLWVSLASGEILYLQDNKTLSYHPDSVPGFFFEDKNGQMVFISEKGNLFSYTTGKINVLPVSNPVQHSKITGLLKKQKDVTWLVTSSGILELKQNGDMYAIKPVLTELQAVTTLFMSRDRQIYAGTQGNGLFRIEANDTTYHPEKVFFSKSSYNNSDYTENLPFKNIYHIFQDREGHLWVSNELGIALLYPRFFINPHPGVFNYLLNGMTQLEDGSFCFGSINQLVLLNPVKNTMTPGVRFEDGSVASVTSENNRIWTGNTNGNLYCTKGNIILNTIRLDKRGGSIFSIYADRKHRIWFCQVFKDKLLPGITATDSTYTLRYYGTEKGLKGRILVARENRNGTIYLGGIGENTYLYRFDEKQNTFINLSLPLPFENRGGFEVHDITIDSQENIWMATSKGVLKYSIQNKTLQRIELGEYITNTEIRSIIADKSDQIWIATDAFGLLLYKNGITLRYTVENGLVNNVLWYRLLFMDKSGRLWVGTNSGYVVSGRNMPTPVVTQKPVISKFLCNDKQTIDTKKEIRVPYHASLEVSFMSLSYPTQTIEYQIKTREIDKLGVVITEKNTVKLSELTTGSYEMEIKAKQLGYAWSEPLIVRFYVERVWYRSWWAYLGYILAGVLIIRWIVILYTNYLRKERERLNSIVAEKTSELSEKNKEITEQNAEITAQNEELMSQQEEITSQRDILATQNQYLHEARQIIEEQNHEIKSHNDYLEKEVKFRTQELEEYNQQLEQFAFITAHNLRAPVARILGLGTVLSLNRDNIAEQQVFVEKMIFAARELDQVIKDLNMILTIRKSYVNVNTPINLTEEIEKLKKSLRDEINETQTTIREDIEPMLVFLSFAPYIESILYNLVSNAIKYRHPDRKPVIEIKMRWIDDMVYLTVRDNGLGMDLNAYRDKLFTLYKRFHLHLEGKGMGLYIVKTQVNALGGKIDLESSINEGTVFHILLPATASKIIHTSI